MDSVRLFVYGTLKRGCSNANRLSGAEFECEARTARGFVLHLAERYPVLVRDERAEGGVRGEVFRVSVAHLAELDEFEGCPDLYERTVIPLEDGSVAMAYGMPLRRAKDYPRLSTEDWSEASEIPHR